MLFTRGAVGLWPVAVSLAAAAGCSLLAPSDEELGGGSATSGTGASGAAGGASSATAGGGGSGEPCAISFDDPSLEGTASVVFRSYLDALVPTGDGREGMCDVVTGRVLPVSRASATFHFASMPSASGLEWTAYGAEAASSDALDELRARLHGAVQLTLELVVDVVSVDASSPAQGSQLIHLGDDVDMLTLAVVGSTGDVIYALGDGRAYWQDVDMTTEGRVVVHVTYDASATLPEDRGTLFVDGVAQPPALDLDLQGPVALPATSTFYIGGRRGLLSIEGRIHYVAIYDDLLLSSQIVHNVDRLASDDDRP